MKCKDLREEFEIMRAIVEQIDVMAAEVRKLSQANYEQQQIIAQVLADKLNVEAELAQKVSALTHKKRLACMEWADQLGRLTNLQSQKDFTQELNKLKDELEEIDTREARAQAEDEQLRKDILKKMNVHPPVGVSSKNFVNNAIEKHLEPELPEDKNKSQTERLKVEDWTIEEEFEILEKLRGKNQEMGMHIKTLRSLTSDAQKTLIEKMTTDLSADGSAAQQLLEFNDKRAAALDGWWKNFHSFLGMQLDYDLPYDFDFAKQRMKDVHYEEYIKNMQMTKIMRALRKKAEQGLLS